jgi:hypothetical protein
MCQQNHDGNGNLTLYYKRTLNPNPLPFYGEREGRRRRTRCPVEVQKLGFVSNITRI